MQVKATITHTVYFEVQEGTTIEAVRASALSKIDNNYSDDQGEGTIEEKVTFAIEEAVPGVPTRESVEIQITEV